MSKARTEISLDVVCRRLISRARRLLIIKHLNHEEPRRRELFDVRRRRAPLVCTRGTSLFKSNKSSRGLNTCMREASVGRRGLSGNGTSRADGRARLRIGINKPVLELISVSAARDVTRLIEIGTCYTSSHTSDAPLGRRCLLTGGGGGAPAPPYTRAVPPAPKNFPCMRGSGPLSSRGTHSAFSQEQSVTSEPSTGLERRRAAPRRAHRRRGLSESITTTALALIIPATCSLPTVDPRVR